MQLLPQPPAAGILGKIQFYFFCNYPSLLAQKFAAICRPISVQHDATFVESCLATALQESIQGLKILSGCTAKIYTGR